MKQNVNLVVSRAGLLKYMGFKIKISRVLFLCIVGINLTKTILRIIAFLKHDFMDIQTHFYSILVFMSVFNLSILIFLDFLSLDDIRYHFIIIFLKRKTDE